MNYIERSITKPATNQLDLEVAKHRRHSFTRISPREHSHKDPYKIMIITTVRTSSKKRNLIMIAKHTASTIRRFNII